MVRRPQASSTMRRRTRTSSSASGRKGPARARC